MNGELFSDLESLAVPAAKILLSGPRAASGTSLFSSNPVLYITGTMQEEETDVLLKQKGLYCMMRSFSPADITEATISIFSLKRTP